MKQCTKCLCIKPLDEFSFRKNGNPTRKPACKTCYAADTRRRYALEPERWLRYAKISRQDPEVRRKINDRRNAARRKNPSLELWRLARWRARRNGLPFDITVEDVVVPATCPILGIPLKWGRNKRQLDDSPTVDRIIPSRGYVRGNVCVISWRANRIKSDATLNELQAIIAYMRRGNVSGDMWAALGVAVVATAQARLAEAA